MGFFVTVLYFVIYYLTPATIFGPLAAFHVELILAVLVVFISLPTLSESFIGKTPQSLALVGLAFAIVLSVVFGMHWLGGAPAAFLSFIPNAFAYFLVCLHCDSKKKLQVMVLMMLSVCLFVIAQGTYELRHVVAPTTAVEEDEEDSIRGMSDFPYLVGMKNDTGEWFYRVGGLGEINDPNDFAQLIVCVIPLVFIFWRPRKTFQNTLFVLVPVGVLLFGTYLTHSRGSVLALMAMLIVAARRKIGTVASLLIAGGMFAVSTALKFTGGREISAGAGEDRADLWAQGLELLKTHPLFGVGFNQMADYAGHTAHNSLVVCAAELGLFGLYFWSLFLFPTVRDALTIASPGNVTESVPVAAEKTPFPQLAYKVEAIDKAEINSLGRLVVLSLTGFLVTGWFLSRAFVMTLFLLGGLAEVVFEMALRRGMVSPRLPSKRVFRFAGVLAIVLLLVMYIVLRGMNLVR